MSTKLNPMDVAKAASPRLNGPIDFSSLPAADGAQPSLPNPPFNVEAYLKDDMERFMRDEPSVIGDVLKKNPGLAPQGTPDGVPLQANPKTVVHDPATCWHCLNQGKIS